MYNALYIYTQYRGSPLCRWISRSQKPALKSTICTIAWDVSTTHTNTSAAVPTNDDVTSQGLWTFNAAILRLFNLYILIYINVWRPTCRYMFYLYFVFRCYKKCFHFLFVFIFIYNANLGNSFRVVWGTSILWRIVYFENEVLLYE